MSVFRDSAQAAEFLGGFFREETAKAGHYFAGSGVIIAYTLTDPALRLVMDASVSAEPGRAFAFYINDDAAPAPGVEFFMDADTFDKVYSGEVQPMALMMSGKVKAKGDVTIAMRLLPAMAAAIPHYKAYRAAHPLSS
ncbi:MAG TPA: SCP2 sterol-binding domain-containing protein [Candidatus Baltobacteraceae bacterium]|nr:SCP2 sterol-binding domain-containing protein [Candidatus Baltobacteraceae bacterium]